MFTLPSAPTLTVTRLGTVSPTTKFKLDARGRLVPEGYTVRYPPDVGSVTVVLIITAFTPVAGTPPTPATCTLIVPPGPILPGRLPVDVRVSRIRAGDSDLNRVPSVDNPPNQPATSMTTCVVPCLLKAFTLPSVPTLATTRLAAVSPAEKFRLDARGSEASEGNTVR